MESDAAEDADEEDKEVMGPTFAPSLREVMDAAFAHRFHWAFVPFRPTPRRVRPSIDPSRRRRRVVQRYFQKRGNQMEMEKLALAQELDGSGRANIRKTNLAACPPAASGRAICRSCS